MIELLELLGFGYEPPDGPSTPFAMEVFVFDLLRLICIVGGVALLLATPFALMRSAVLGQKARLLGSNFLALFIVITQAGHIGDLPHVRLYIGFFGIVMVVWGYWSFFAHEYPAKIRPGKISEPIAENEE